jgi:hypothetical protein
MGFSRAAAPRWTGEGGGSILHGSTRLRPGLRLSGDRSEAASPTHPPEPATPGPLPWND